MSNSCSCLSFHQSSRNAQLHAGQDHLQGAIATGGNGVWVDNLLTLLCPAALCMMKARSMGPYCARSDRIASTLLHSLQDNTRYVSMQFALPVYLAELQLRMTAMVSGLHVITC
jgi:hypothetical protein